MSYSISVCRRALAGAPPAVFEDRERIPIFSSEEREALLSHLTRCTYEVVGQDDDSLRLHHPAWADIEARLSDRLLSLSSSVDRESIYTICELGAELALDDRFALFNPQEGGVESRAGFGAAGRAGNGCGSPRAGNPRESDCLRNRAPHEKSECARRNGGRVRSRGRPRLRRSWRVGHRPRHRGWPCGTDHPSPYWQGAITLNDDPREVDPADAPWIAEGARSGWQAPALRPVESSAYVAPTPHHH